MESFTLTSPTFINGFNQHYFADVTQGWLSIKCMFNGEAHYALENGRITVNDANYLILNDNQPYQITIDSPHTVESFCVFFPQSWASEVMRQFTDSLDARLDDPARETAVLFHNVNHHHDNTVTPIIQELRADRKNGRVDDFWQTEKLYTLLERIILVQKEVHHEIAKLPAIRKTTREELFRRLNQGRSFIHDNYQNPISLQEIAQNAYLSPYHFSRNFKQLFGATPQGYLTQRRLAKAQSLLKQSNLSITDICFDVGFQSVGSFSTLFQRHFGVSPSQFRKEAQ